MKPEIEQQLKVIKFKDIVNEVNKELSNEYGEDVINDILSTTRKVLLSHILYTEYLKLDLFGIADFYVYKDRTNHPVMLEKGVDIVNKVSVKPRLYIKKFIKKRSIHHRTPEMFKKLFKSGSVLDDDNVEIDFL